MKKIINGIEIDVRSENSLYVTINGVIFYLEHSDAAPMFMDCWNEIDSYKYEQTIKESESICSECDKKINDDVETKWDLDADPYCRECYGESQ